MKPPEGRLGFKAPDPEDLKGSGLPSLPDLPDAPDYLVFKGPTVGSAR